jgi:hypothetical protein
MMCRPVHMIYTFALILGACSKSDPGAVNTQLEPVTTLPSSTTTSSEVLAANHAQTVAAPTGENNPPSHAMQGMSAGMAMHGHDGGMDHAIPGHPMNGHHDGGMPHPMPGHM